MSVTSMCLQASSSGQRDVCGRGVKEGGGGEREGGGRNRFNSGRPPLSSTRPSPPRAPLLSFPLLPPHTADKALSSLQLWLQADHPRKALSSTPLPSPLASPFSSRLSLLLSPLPSPLAFPFFPARCRQGTLFDCDFNQQLALGLPLKPCNRPSPLLAPSLFFPLPLFGILYRQGALFDCDFNQHLGFPSKPPTAYVCPLSTCFPLSSPSYRQGALFDCDFNQQLALGLPPKPSTAPNSPLTSPPPPPRTVFGIQSLEELVDRPIATAAHCYG
ncbi:unnamed protein product [Closterium sp. Naga37s-1]|nr:unnamed protein product [Closterium sp. Naga37s-1]